MQLPLQITFRHMDPSPALEARIRQRADELERFFDRVTACRVVVERMNRRHQQGNLFEIRIDLTVPGREIAVGSDRGANHAHEDAHVAVRDAFDAARRALEDHARRRRGEAKVHAVPDHGRIARLLAEKDCGFIETPGGEEIYFHRNSVADDGFDKLEVGGEVRFVAQEGESPNGPQASTVVPLGKHRLPPTEAVRK
ncbi:MAG TPA: HPF/RaiA family ribosome-associated protein [Stellaceae bacterium]|nr:HPF/RaiA family ribosome-associated protein [Stellaceae bacterium]